MLMSNLNVTKEFFTFKILKAASSTNPNKHAL